MYIHNVTAVTRQFVFINLIIGVEDILDQMAFVVQLVLSKVTQMFDSIFIQIGRGIEKKFLIYLFKIKLR